MKLIIVILWLAIGSSTFASEEMTIRYKGKYTFGHEVNVFCPQINSQCYWLGSDTEDEERTILKQLSMKNKIKPYDAVCVIIEGTIDKKMDKDEIDGFAADYDGTIDVTKVYGLCTDTEIVTEGDLQHHRWILESINHQKLDLSTLNQMVPELDFGESMHVSGNLGCNRFSGLAHLEGETFRVEKMISTRMMCAPAQNNIESTMHRLLGKPSKITLDADKNLHLQTEETLFIFRLKDWVL